MAKVFTVKEIVEQVEKDLFDEIYGPKFNYELVDEKLAVMKTMGSLKDKEVTHFMSACELFEELELDPKRDYSVSDIIAMRDAIKALGL